LRIIAKGDKESESNLNKQKERVYYLQKEVAAFENKNERSRDREKRQKTNGSHFECKHYWDLLRIEKG
jgi:hypothetical protein